MTDRARIPFALVGVLLLASSATLAPALNNSADLGPPDVDVAMDRLTAQTRGAVEEGVDRGARRSARGPVLRPANTTFGRVLDDDEPFRDALQVRIYATVRDHLSRIETDRRGLELNASLPPTETPASLGRAIERMTVEPAGPNGTSLRASVGNVTLTARRDGRVVARKRIDPTVVVPVPVLPVHDRVRSYQRRLDGSPLQPGLGRRLTAKLYGLTWARGYAQYGGLPIQNVLANRHLSLLANGAVLRTQQRVFGRSDPVGKRVHALTTLKTAIVDVLGAEAQDTLERLQRVRRAIRIGRAQIGRVLARSSSGSSPPDPSQSTTVGVNTTADRAFYDLLGNFNGSIDAIFTADVRLRVTEGNRTGGEPGWPTPPGDECSRISNISDEVVDVEPARKGAAPPTDGDWHLLEAYPRRVEITRTNRRTWRCGGQTVRRRESATETVQVALRLEGFHWNGPAPPAPVEVVHEPDGPFDGPNLADLREKAEEALLPGEDGVAEVAYNAALGNDVERTVQVEGEWPGPLFQWIYTNVATLRETVRDVHVNTTRGKVATFQARPANALLEKLRNRSSRLVGVPARYENVAHRALIGLRKRYVRLVLARMRDRVTRRNEGLASFTSKLRDRENVSVETLQESYERRDDFEAVPAAAVEMRVHAAPSYLTTSKTTRAEVPALGPDESLHPLVVRNFNVVHVPYGDFADAILKEVFGPTHVRLRTGAEILDAAYRVGKESSFDESAEVAALRAETKAALDVVAARYGRTMERTGIGVTHEWREVFQSALRTNDTVRSRAFAVSNGWIVPHLVDAAAKRWPDRIDGPVRRDRTAVASAVALNEILETGASGPTQPRTDRALTPVRDRIEAAITDRLGDMIANASMEVLREHTDRVWSRLPSGLPVAPSPGLWHATINAWHTQVRGEYARFAVTVPRGTPANPGAALAYIRDGSTVAVDVDADGHPERLGKASRISFQTESLVGVAVPPYSAGVGDVDGEQNETSAGWPWPSEPPAK
ncbi:MAG: hypothetical protein V5A43_01780 [Haloarculaceae archaeon]